MDSILLEQNKDFTRDGQEIMKVPRAVTEAKGHFSDNSLEFGKYSEDLSWNHRTCTSHRSETNGTAERTARRVKELQPYCYNQDWMKDSD